MKALTVITTTFNRGYCIHQVYESLLRQTSDDFIWMIIDDGSTDNTRELITSWMNEAKLDIEYYYKPNGGMHTARNLAYEKVHTEINVIIDSDDWMTDDAVRCIVDFWNKHKTLKAYGIVANNISKSGELIGSPLPLDVTACTLTELELTYKVKGDKKIILRSDLSKKYPFPEFDGEKFYPASFKYKMLDQDYNLLLMPEAICVVDYNQDSMTYNKFAQYQSCCRGFAHYRNEIIRLSKSPKILIPAAIHYIAESHFANDKTYIRHSAKPLVIVFCLPLGIAYYHSLCRTKRKY